MPSLSEVLKSTAATIVQRWWRAHRTNRRTAAAITIQRWWRSHLEVQTLAWELQVEALRAELAALTAIRPTAASTEPFGISPPPTVQLPFILPYHKQKEVLVVVPPEDAAGFVATAATVCPEVRFTCMSPPSNGIFKQNIKLSSAIAAADYVVWSAHGCAGDGCIVLLPVQHKQFKFAALPVRDLVEQLIEICGPSVLRCLFLDICFGMLNVPAEPLAECPTLSVYTHGSVNVYGYREAPLQSQSPLGLAAAFAHFETAN